MQRNNTKDVLRLVNNLIRNTTPKGAQSSDPFWERAETALLEALILYLVNEAPPEEQNFSMVMEMINAAEAGDTITATKDGIAYTYTVSDVVIYESTSDWRLPTLDGSTLVLVTCYPFRYSGHAPGKYMVTARLVK